MIWFGFMMGCSGTTPGTDSDTERFDSPPTLEVEAQAIIETEQPWSVGYAVAGPGDVDGDGVDDILVGALSGNRVCVFSGSIFGEVDFSDATACFVGETGDFLGFAVSGAGDVNADGRADILLAATGADAGGTDRGVVYLFLGDEYKGDIPVSQAYASFPGEADLDGLGTGLAAAGDVNDDGFDDFLIGAPGNDAGGDAAGAAYLITGPISPGEHPLSESTAIIEGIGNNVASSLRHGIVTGVATGNAVAGVGDVNGDGFDDILISAGGSDALAEDAGLAGLFFGPLAGQFDFGDTDVRFFGNRAFGYFGEPLGSVGDVDGDGLPDIAMASNGVTTEEIWIFTNPQPGNYSRENAYRILSSSAPGDRFSWSFAVIHHDDDTRELVIGAPLSNLGANEAGAAWLISMPISTGAVSVSASWPCAEPGALAGQAVTAVGDVNGDGRGDWVVGAPYAAGGQGRVFLMWGQ